jgi:LPS-assembly protein
MRAYQSIQLHYDNGQLPYVLPYVQYEYAPKEKVAGGDVTYNANILSVFRLSGPHTQRVAQRANWTRQDFDPLGGMWTFRLQGDVNGYWAGDQQLSPTFLPGANGLRQNSNLRAAVDWRMPFIRYSEDGWGNQVLEPRVQLVTGPRLGRQTRLPNEDAIDFEFTDANLFALNRHSGLDRMEGGTRADAALRGAWNFPNGGQFSGLIGRSYAIQDDHSTSQEYTYSGLANRASDWVTQVRLSPVPWFETMGRIRTDSQDFAQRRMVDTTARLNLGSISLNAGYLLTPPLPYLANFNSREEVSLGTTVRINENFRFNVAARYELSTSRFAVIQGGAGYEDECVIIEGRFLKRYNQDLLTHQAYPINTVVLIHVGLKTLGDYFFRAL